MKASCLASFIALVSLSLLAGCGERGPGEGVGQRVGREVDQALNQAGEELREGFQKARTAVDQMGVTARVYSRLRWDKSLNNASIDIDADKDAVVTLSGSVPTEEAKTLAGKLAEDTVGVERVVNELAVK